MCVYKFLKYAVAFIGLVAILALLPTMLVAKEIQGSYFSYGNWIGAAYTNDQTGSFSHCAVTAEYVTGDTLIFSLDRSGAVGVGVSSPELNLQPGTRFPVSVEVDNRRSFTADAVAKSSDLAILYIDNLEAALNAFRRGFNLQIEAIIEGEYVRGGYSLKGTFRALDMMTECAVEHISTRVGYDGSTNSNPESNSFDEAILYQVATKTIATLDIQNFVFATSDELKSAGLGQNVVRWAAPDNGLTATFLALPTATGTNLKDLDADDTKFLSAKCTDEYVSSARNINEENLVIREIRVACAQGNTITEHFLNKFQFRNHLIYSWFEFVGTPQVKSRQSSQEKSEKAAILAAKFLR